MKCVGLVKAVVGVAALMSLASCQGLSPATPPPAPAAGQAALTDDPCAERLHDLAGQLLLYWVKNHDLPAELADLTTAQSRPAVGLICPVSHKPYLYSRCGLAIISGPKAGLKADTQARVIVYDGEPSHHGMRWAIVAEPPGAGEALVPTVTLLREDAVRWPSQALKAEPAEMPTESQ